MYKAELGGLLGREPALGVHQGLDFLAREACGPAVCDSQALGEVVQDLGLRPQLCRIARSDGPGLVQHVGRIGGGQASVARHIDHRGDRGGDAIDPGGDLGPMLAQQIENGDPIEDRTAGTVYPHGDLVHRAEPFELLGEDLSAEAAEPVADLLVDQDLGCPLALGGETGESGVIGRRPRGLRRGCREGDDIGGIGLALAPLLETDGEGLVLVVDLLGDLFHAARDKVVALLIGSRLR